MKKQKSYRKFLASFTKSIITIFISVLVIYGVVYAGSLTPPSGEPSASLFTLSDIYNRLTTNISASEGSHSFSFDNTFTSSGHTLSDIYNAIPAINPSKLLDDTTYLGVTGNIPTLSLSSSSVNLNAGYYEGNTLNTIDTDLQPTNIKKGQNIFGIEGLLLPEGGDSTPAHVLVGKSFFGGSQTDWNLQTGTMPDHTGIPDFNPTSVDVAIPFGYYDGVTKILGDVDLIPENIKLGTDIFGISGTLLPSGGDTTPAQVLIGTTFFGGSQNDWNLQMGTMPDYGAFSLSASATDQVVPAGYYSGGTLLGDPDLTSDKILSGTNIFGVEGSLVVTELNGTPYDISNLTPDNVRKEITFGNGEVGTFEVGYTYGDNNPNNVLTLAATPGSFDATGLLVGTVKKGINFGVGLVGDYPSATHPLDGDTVATDSIAENVLSGGEFWTKDGTVQTGTMANHGAFALIPGLTDQAITPGYYSGGTLAGSPDLTASNIKSGATIFGVAGTFAGYLYGDNDASKVLTGATGVGTYNATNLADNKVLSGTAYGVGHTGTLVGAVGDAIASNVLAGKYFSNGTTSNILGTMPSKVGSATIYTPSTSDQIIAEGYYGGVVGDGKVLGDTDLIASNIASGVDIFGVSGTLLKNLWSGSATSGDYPQSTGGVDDYNNGGVTPADSYKGSWTTCNAGNSYCGTGDSVNADKKDNSTGIIWSKWLAAGASKTWFWANNAKYPNGLPGDDGVCDTNGEVACKVVKLVDADPGGKTGCDFLGGGWRLPYQKELMLAYVDGSWANLSSAGGGFWSATTVSANTQGAWVTNLYNGATYNPTKTNGASYKVRCVR